MNLYDWQQEDAEWLAGGNRLLAHDCGLGKTYIAAKTLVDNARGPVLVVSPRLSKEWWKEVLEGFGAQLVGVCESAGRGVNWKKLAKYKGRPYPFVIVHPTAVRMSYKDMVRIRWGAICVDEAHRFKNRKAKQTKALWKLSADWRIALTATPYGKSPADMWAILHWLQPKKYTSYWRFYHTYVDSFQPPGQRFHIVKGPKNLQLLAQTVEPYYLKRKKDDLLDLPPITYQDRPVIIGGEQYELYRKLEKEAYALLHGQEIILSNALVQFLRLQQCALDPNQLAEDLPMFPVGSVPAKVEWLEEWLEDHPDEPVIITSRYRKFVESWLRDIAPKACIVGGMSQQEALRAVKHFNKTGRLVGSLDAIKESLNLQRAATMIIADGTYSSTDEYQLANRIHRIGQKHPCTVIHLVGKLPDGRYTVDKKMRDSVNQGLSEAAMVDQFVKELKA